MKKPASKKWVALVCIICLLVLFVPRVTYLKDGGSREYNALTYSVTKLHKMNSVESDETFTTGTVIKIFGMEVYNSVEE